MNAITSVAAKGSVKPEIVTQSSSFNADVISFSSSDSSQFRAALERHLQGAPGTASVGAENKKTSLGDKIIGRATNMANELKNDQTYVSKLLEQATRNADSMQLMRAMMALNDYQMRVQFISKTASKATQALDQLTKLQ